MAVDFQYTRLILRNDSTAAWLASKDQVLFKGEVGIEFLEDGTTKIKIGDGVKTWAELPYHNELPEIEIPEHKYYEVTVAAGVNHGEAIASRVGDDELITGDIIIVKEFIATDDATGNNSYQFTGYTYNEADQMWKPMDGNYNAENIILNEDLVYTAPIGVKTVPASGSGTIAAKGKSLEAVLKSILAEEKNPTHSTATSASITSSNIGAKEVGTSIAIQYAFSTSAPTYTYGPANGVTWSGHTATFNGETKTEASGTFTAVTVTDDTKLIITGSVSNSDGTIPVTNTGNPYAAGQIKAKDHTGLTKGTLTGYRAWFCGYKNGDNAIKNVDGVVDATAITGDQIRALGNAANGSWKTSLSVTGMQQMFFAAPAGKGYKPSVKDAQTTAPQTVQGPITVYVKGANNYVAEGDETTNGGMAYDVWYVNNTLPASGSANLTIGIA